MEDGCGCGGEQESNRHIERSQFFSIMMKILLSCTINLAFYFAREYYTIIRELPAGKGFADICLYPKKAAYADKPAVVIELKWDKSSSGAY